MSTDVVSHDPSVSDTKEARLCPSTGRVCSSARLAACDVHEQHAGQGPEATPCGQECPSKEARAAAIAELVAEVDLAKPREHGEFKLHRRWDRAARLFGEQVMEQLARTSVTVFGLGGVGSFAAEGLVRSGVGRLVLVDFDDVCVTNVNRQLHAMRGAYSKPKCHELAARFRRINPAADIVPIKAFYNAESAQALLSDSPDYVVDAIDNFAAKIHLIATCLERAIPLVSSMGAAGKLDPTQVRVADIAKTHGDAMAREVRKLLRKKHGIGIDGGLVGVNAVFSPEPRTYPEELSYDAEAGGFLCVCPSRANDFHSCDSRNLIDGSAGYVTSVFGMVAASVVVNSIRDHVRSQRAAPTS